MTKRYVCGFSPGAGSSTLPQGSIYAGASGGGSLIEAGAWGNNATAKRLQLVRLTSTGTQGTGQSESKYDDDAPASQCQCFLTHTVAPGLGDKLHVSSAEGLAQQGIIIVFPGRGIEIPVGVANGIGWFMTTASGALDVHFVWDES